MPVSLQKGGNVSLSKEAPSMTKALIGLGWDERQTDGVDFDLDASAFLVDASGKVRSEKDFIFYNQLSSICGSVVHQGDNRTGAGEGDDEQIIADLEKVPADIQKIVITVTIHDEKGSGLNFGQVSNAFIRIADNANGNEVVRYDLSEDYSTETAMVFAELYRKDGGWSFRAIGQGYSGGLAALCGQYGVNVG